MTLLEFEDLIDRHGGDLTRWPVGPRGEAAKLLQSSAPARAALAAMREVERFLTVSHAPSLDHEAMAARASRRPQSRPVNRYVTKTGWSAAAAALLAIGILFGRTGGITGDDDPSTTLARALASTEIIDVD
jgi:hypothetical protein